MEVEEGADMDVTAIGQKAARPKQPRDRRWFPVESELSNRSFYNIVIHPERAPLLEAHPACKEISGIGTI